MPQPAATGWWPWPAEDCATAWPSACTGTRCTAASRWRCARKGSRYRSTSSSNTEPASPKLPTTWQMRFAIPWSACWDCRSSRSTSTCRASTSAASPADTATLTGAATMPITECDGRLFKEALLGSLAWLTLNRDEVDALNVFPVPDGDTGTNMLLTLQSAVDDVRDFDDPDLSAMA